MKTKETSFRHKFISSIKDFEKYPHMASKPFSVVINYLIKLMLIFSLIVTMISIFELSKDIQEGIEYFKIEIPNLKFENNQLIVDSKETIKIQPNNIIDIIVINTNDISEEEINSYINDISNYNTGIIFLKDKIILNMGQGNVQYLYNKLTETYNIGNMSKDEILNYFTGYNLIRLYIPIFIMTFISLFIAYMLSVLLDSFVLGMLGHITALLLRIRLKFVAMFKIAMHSLTLPVILNLCYIILDTIFNFNIKYFEVMYVAVAYIYIITAILMIKSDLIKRGQELTKIIEEEQKVREDLKKEDENQEENDKEEDNKKEENNKEKKKENKSEKKDNLEGEPQGENA